MAKAGSASASPPFQRPKYPSDRELSYGMKWSLIVHLAIFTAILIKGLVFPGTPIVYVPSLRVDIVGLPDMLKQDLKNVPKAPVADENTEETRPEEKTPAPKAKEKPAPKHEKAEPDEMVLKPKKANKEAETEAERQKRIKSALQRIKSLAKLGEDKAPSSVAIKGNKISKGSSLSGDARENSQSGYFDSVRDRLQENWALPIWLQRQKLTAQVQIWIDSRGKLRNFKFLRASGNAQFDDMVKKTLQQSQPFPAPPEDLASSLLVDGISVGFPL